MKCLTYMGNKRKLLSQIEAEVAAVTPPGGVVADLFSGSGVVAWHLRSKGYVVHANDIAGYSLPINQANLEYTPASLAAEYPDFDGLLAELNGLTSPPPGGDYFANYYSDNPAAKYPRLYYTRRNGLFLDAVLTRVQGLGERERNLVLSDVLYKMSKHVNTSGHFKTWHKEFGGVTNKHDVARITADISIDRPDPGAGPLGRAWRADATDFFRHCAADFDCAYLDPPNNIHQYSANYHLLEAACLPPGGRYVPRQSQVSGIDPSLYKSPYCSKYKATPTFVGLLRAMRGRVRALVLSFSPTGYITLAEMEGLLGEWGAVKTAAIPGGSRTEYLLTVVAKKK